MKMLRLGFEEDGDVDGVKLVEDVVRFELIGIMSEISLMMMLMVWLD